MEKNEDSTKNIVYEIEYSPCDFTPDNVLYITILGFEKKSDYKINISLIQDKSIKILCNQIPIKIDQHNFTNNALKIESDSIKVSPPELFNYGCVLTDLGTIRFGGSFNHTVNNDLYLFDSANKWQKMVLKGNSKPIGRYGHSLFYFDNYLILFGGKDKDDNTLGDLYVFDFTQNKWLAIDYTVVSELNNIKQSELKNQHNKKLTNQNRILKFLASGTLIANLGKLIIYGGQNNFDDKNIYLLDLKNLIDYIRDQNARNPNNFFDFNKNKVLNNFEKLKDLWEIKNIDELTPRFGLSITQINNHEIMLFGGIDRNSNSVSTLEILNLKTFKVTIVEPKNTNEFPSGRAYHKVQKIGPILILIGGENSNSEVFGEIWKFTLDNFKWIKLDLDKNLANLIKRSNFYFTKIFKDGFLFERPVIYGGYGRNKELRSDFILLDFEICTSSVTIPSKKNCTPCSEGYVLNANGNCEACSIGYYQNFEDNIVNKNIQPVNDEKAKSIAESNEKLNEETNYSLNYYELYLNSKCQPCPKKTYNNKFAMSNISSCKLCENGFYNNLNGKGSCFNCSKDEVCLAGTENPIKDLTLSKEIESVLINEKNFPDFLDANSKTQFFTKLVGLIVLLIINLFLLTILTICYCFRKEKTMQFLIYSDFIPLTGGTKKKTNGGLITLIYLAIIISFTLFFIIRFLYFNEEIEVISLTHSIGDLNKKEFSLRIEVDLLGYESNCINTENKIKDDYYDCHPDIDVNKIENNVFSHIKTGDNKNNIYCKLTKESNICQVFIECKECENIKTDDEIEIYLKDPNAFVQAYKWSLESYWSEDFIEKNGFSKIYSIFLASKDNKYFKFNQFFNLILNFFLLNKVLVLFLKEKPLLI